MDNEFILQDRIQKIQQIISKYGEENFYISYSGGLDSNVLSALIDMALPENKIPRVYADTGIELNAVRDFVKAKCAEDSRFEMIKPSVPIKKMLETEGYPFKSKFHSYMVAYYHKHGRDNKTIRKYLKILSEGEPEHKWYGKTTCPKCLEYQFEENDMSFKISDKCCDRLKKEPLEQWQRENGKVYAIIGITLDEGGQRASAKCLAFSGKKLKAFQPLVAVSKEWERWFIDTYNISLPIVYYPPYNFQRTGCKGCPFAIGLQHELDILQEYFPNERKQCEAIWKPVYDEYRRLGYRLKKEDAE